MLRKILIKVTHEVSDEEVNHQRLSPRLVRFNLFEREGRKEFDDLSRKRVRERCAFRKKGRKNDM